MFAGVPVASPSGAVAQRARTATALVALLALVGCSQVPDWANPVEWYDSVAGDDVRALPPAPRSDGVATSAPPPGSDSFPTLATVPSRPVPSSTSEERAATVAGLVADRRNASYSDEALRPPGIEETPLRNEQAFAQLPIAPGTPGTPAEPAPSGLRGNRPSLATLPEPSRMPAPVAPVASPALPRDQIAAVPSIISPSATTLPPAPPLPAMAAAGPVPPPVTGGAYREASGADFQVPSIVSGNAGAAPWLAAPRPPVTGAGALPPPPAPGGYAAPGTLPPLPFAPPPPPVVQAAAPPAYVPPAPQPSAPPAYAAPAQPAAGAGLTPPPPPPGLFADGQAGSPPPPAYPPAVAPAYQPPPPPVAATAVAAPGYAVPQAYPSVQPLPAPAAGLPIPADQSTFSDTYRQFLAQQQQMSPQPYVQQAFVPGGQPAYAWPAPVQAPAAYPGMAAAPAAAGAPPLGQAGGEPAAVVRFATGGRQLSSEDRRAVRRLAEQARRDGGWVRVVGHASQRTGNMSYERHKQVNFDLSVDRAEAVAAELRKAGVPPERIIVQAMGDSQPRFFEFMPNGEAQNRRAEIYIE